MSDPRQRRLEWTESDQLRPSKRTARMSTGTPRTYAGANLTPSSVTNRDRDSFTPPVRSATAPPTGGTPTPGPAERFRMRAAATSTPLRQTASTSLILTGIHTPPSTPGLSTPITAAQTPRRGAQKDVLTREDMVMYGFVLVRAVSEGWYACPADQVCMECTATGRVCIVEALELVGQNSHLRRLVCIPCRATHSKCSHATSTVGVTFDWVARLTTRPDIGIQAAAEEASRRPAVNASNRSAYVLERVEKDGKTLTGRKHNSARRQRQGKTPRVDGRMSVDVKEGKGSRSNNTCGIDQGKE